MNELSNYGDAVTSTTERDNEYQQIWTNSLSQLNDLSKSEGDGILNNMEESLNIIYSQILEANNAMPASLLEIVLKQKEAISNSLKDR